MTCISFFFILYRAIKENSWEAYPKIWKIKTWPHVKKKKKKSISNWHMYIYRRFLDKSTDNLKISIKLIRSHTFWIISSKGMKNMFLDKRKKSYIFKWFFSRMKEMTSHRITIMISSIKNFLYTIWNLFHFYISNSFWENRKKESFNQRNLFIDDGSSSIEYFRAWVFMIRNW